MKKTIFLPGRKFVKNTDSWGDYLHTLWNRSLLFGADLLVNGIFYTPVVNKFFGKGIIEDDGTGRFVNDTNTESPSNEKQDDPQTTPSEKTQEPPETKPTGAPAKATSSSLPHSPRVSSPKSPILSIRSQSANALWKTPTYPRRIRYEQLNGKELRKYSARLITEVAK